MLLLVVCHALVVDLAHCRLASPIPFLTTAALPGPNAAVARVRSRSHGVLAPLQNLFRRARTEVGVHTGRREPQRIASDCSRTQRPAAQDSCDRQLELCPRDTVNNVTRVPALLVLGRVTHRTRLVDRVLDRDTTPSAVLHHGPLAQPASRQDHRVVCLLRAPAPRRSCGVAVGRPISWHRCMADREGKPLAPTASGTGAGVGADDLAVLHHVDSKSLM